MDTCGNLKVNNIVFSFEDQDVSIFNKLSFEIERGHILAIIGDNGSGKTTLLKLLLGVYKPDFGGITYGQMNNRNTLAKINGLISYLPQFEQIPQGFLVNEYILLGRMPFLSFFGKPLKRDLEKVDEIMGDLNLCQYSSIQIGKISGGELQRVRIARALAQEPAVILLDEPATHLDISKKQMLFSLLIQFQEKGKIIVFSTNDPNEALNYSDFTLLINKKQPALFGKTKRVITTKTISKYFHVESEFINLNNREMLFYK